jgi:hypothetical protein
VTGACVTYEWERIAYRNLVGISEASISHGITRCKLEDNIKIDLKYVGWEKLDWIHLAQKRDR